MYNMWIAEKFGVWNQKFFKHFAVCWTLDMRQRSIAQGKISDLPCAKPGTRQKASLLCISQAVHGNRRPLTCARFCANGKPLYTRKTTIFKQWITFQSLDISLPKLILRTTQLYFLFLFCNFYSVFSLAHSSIAETYSST